jgi:predicted DNA-binding protein
MLNQMARQKMSNKRSKKTTTIMSFSLPHDIQEKIKKSASIRDMNNSQVVKEMVEKYLPFSEEGNADTMNFSLPPDILEKIEKYALVKNSTNSQVIKEMVEKYLPSSDEGFDTIILKIPNDFKETEVKLRNWFSVRVDALVKLLVKKNS